MKILTHLIQGTQEWLDYRKNHIMATDSSSILGVNTWKSKRQLYEEKMELVPPQEMNEAMKRGQQLEPVARQLFNELTELDMQPCVVESEKHPWLAASLDGLCRPKSVILEIKCPNQRTHDFALKVGIPEYYQCQIQHQLLVTRANYAYYMSYRPECVNNPYKMIKVFPDQEYGWAIIHAGWIFYSEYLFGWKEPD